MAREYFGVPSMQKPGASQQSQEANRCIVNSNDCKEAGEYIDIALEFAERDKEAGTSEYFVARQGLVLGAIVAYGRAFKSSRGGSDAISKFPVDIASILNNRDELVELHAKLIEKRDKVGAHSDWDGRSSVRKDDIEIEGVLRKNTVVNYESNIDLSHFRELAKIMEDHFRFEGYARDKGLPKQK